VEKTKVLGKGEFFRYLGLACDKGLFVLGKSE
jgi:hypothetical protein